MRFDGMPRRCFLIGAIAIVLPMLAGTRVAGAQSVTVFPANTDVFARYITPGQCRQAAGRLLRLYWRDKRPDTVVYAPATDSVPAPVVRAVRACVARFSVGTVPADELRSLAQLYLWTGQDTLARQTFDRLMEARRAESATERGWQLWLWINAALSVRPARTELVRVYLARLDALGLPAALWRLFAHTRYAEYAWSVNDRATAESEGRAAVNAGHQMTGDDRIDWVYSLENAYRSVASPLAFAHGGTAALAWLDTMKVDLGILRPAGSSDRQQLLAELTNVRISFEHLGERNLPHVHADTWYGAGVDTIRPRPGKLTLLVFVYGPSYPMFATLRRLATQYGPQGLDIVFMTTTRGYFRGMPMPSPHIEADSMGSYVRNFLQLPGPLAAEVTSFTHIEDGRRRNQETQNARAFTHWNGVILVDRNGAVRWIDSVQPTTEAIWNAVIRGAL